MKDVEFAAADGTRLSGWYLRPEHGDEPWPIVVVSHGFGAVKEVYLDHGGRGLAV